MNNMFKPQHDNNFEPLKPVIATTNKMCQNKVKRWSTKTVLDLGLHVTRCNQGCDSSYEAATCVTVVPVNPIIAAS